MNDQTWQIDSSHSSIDFSVRHLVIATVRGQFTRWDGTLTATDDDLQRATVKVTIDASSINTGVADRDNHLRSADFFDVETYPEITFSGNRIEIDDDGSLRLPGNLTIRGVTKPVTLEGEFSGRIQDPWGNQRAVFSAKTSVDRREFGLTWNQALETGGVMVGEKVSIQIEIEAVQQSEEKAA